PETYEGLHSRWSAIVEGCAAKFGGISGHSNSERFHVYFGHPRALEDDCERAVRTGVMIQELFSHEATDGPRAAVAPCISVSCGLAIVRKQSNGLDAIVGEVVGLAARNLETGQQGDVLICDNVRRQIGRTFAMESRGSRHAGRGGSGQVWNVTNEIINADRFEALRSETAPFVGRRDELKLLQQQWQRAHRGRGHVTLIKGDAGIGKSRLCRQLRQTIANPAPTVLHFQCSSLYCNSWLYPISQHLRAAAGIELNDDRDRCIEKLGSLLGLSKHSHRGDLARTATLFSKGVGSHTNRADGTATEIRECIFRMLGIYLRQRAAHNPVLIIFEDLHWIDPTSLDLLSRIVEDVSNTPMMVVLTTRPEFEPSWPEYSHFTGLHLNRLARTECTKLIETIASASRLESGAVEAILYGADGNPLYVEEITKALFDQTHKPEDKTHNGGGYGTSNVPWTLHSSLLMRLDNLAHGKEVARIGAVIGVEFSHQLISRVSELADCDLDQGLAELTAAQIVYRYGAAPDATYRFKHILLRDVAYATILGEERKTLHAHILALLEKDAASPAEILAQHAAQAGKREEAITFWRSAATMASKRGAYRDTARHLESAIEAYAGLGQSDSEQALELLGWLAFTWISAEGYLSENARAAAARGCALAEKLDNSIHRFLPRYAQWTLQLATGPQGAVLDYIDHVRETIEQENVESQKFFGNALAGYSALTVGQLELAEKRLKEAERLYDKETHNRGARRVGHIPGPDLFFRLSLLRAVQGRLADHVVYMDRSLAACPDDLDAHAEAQLLMKLCLVCSVTRDYARLATLTDRLVNLYAEFKLDVAHIVGTMYRGMLEVHDGLAEGVVRFSDAAERYELELMKFEMAPRWVALADLLVQSGMLPQARSAHEKARVLIEHTQENLCLAEVQRIAGVLAAHEADNALAERCLREAIVTARQQGAGLWELRAASDLAGLLERLERNGEAAKPLASQPR
ncbi:MAG: AAA family ATPase, partial [Hyphomicrobiaceae bacterium]